MRQNLCSNRQIKTNMEKKKKMSGRQSIITRTVCLDKKCSEQRAQAQAMITSHAVSGPLTQTRCLSLMTEWTGKQTPLDSINCSMSFCLSYKCRTLVFALG
ncbi:hypothetical protein AVEN_265477-1 [Araneus ventricosus]|uniref:Uncharacterized protein n=1 Tax=Araneus ventricosus TaxID=182803 RepID=A0A4Y2CI63_ARAVE|nr:hypothetical protein AVEN_265477-1 [Araneus ventricosus]